MSLISNDILISIILEESIVYGDALMVGYVRSSLEPLRYRHMFYFDMVELDRETKTGLICNSQH